MEDSTFAMEVTVISIKRYQVVQLRDIRLFMFQHDIRLFTFPAFRGGGKTPLLVLQTVDTCSLFLSNQLDKGQMDLNMVIEILSRSSFKTVGKLRCTSKQIQQLTYERHVVDQFRQRNTIASGYIMQQRQPLSGLTMLFVPSTFSMSLELNDILPYPCTIVATSEQGLIVFESSHPTNYELTSFHVCKPTTNQFQALPDPGSDYSTSKASIVIIGLKKHISAEGKVNNVMKEKNEVYQVANGIYSRLIPFSAS
ncbi:hypothetical protein L2E82_22904 [Cichorium intybus]|uniref:Uncharacterized protein n=1 Tax=Cichorium intybus TaxID=13427 RepID=A0ACB9DZG0_CICIN|nr:hypothetical protein L2E82_22904 [Cichorium intybus]